MRLSNAKASHKQLWLLDLLLAKELYVILFGFVWLFFVVVLLLLFFFWGGGWRGGIHTAEFKLSLKVSAPVLLRRVKQVIYGADRPIIVEFSSNLSSIQAWIVKKRDAHVWSITDCTYSLLFWYRGEEIETRRSLNHRELAPGMYRFGES